MGKSLIITEKPSVAQDIARALGGFKKRKEFYESDQAIISWAVGHLFELAVPAAMKDQDKWSLDKLPIMPEEFALNPQSKMGGRVQVLKKLLHDKLVSEVVNACDAGREGELIFRYIIQYAKSTKPIRRLWLSSMTRDAIREAFEGLRSDEALLPLAAAARSRNEADWLVGINATRAFTLRLTGGRGSTVTSLGRVQTPTLAIIVDREKKIERFRERGFWEVIGHFQATHGEYNGRWFDEAYQKNEAEEDRCRRLCQRLEVDPEVVAHQLTEDHGSMWDEHRHPSRLWMVELADAIERRCGGQPGVIELEEKKPTTQSSPLLYDLTSLQREGNTRLGYSARRTLQIAQALYEKHKAITYPRTDSRCLPEDYPATVKKTLASLAHGEHGSFAQRVLDQKWVKANKRIFNNARVSDHFAIIPTATLPANLSDAEAAVYAMIVRRFIAIFFPAARFEVTTRITRVAGEPFKTEGKILVDPGWLEVYGKGAATERDDQEHLPAVFQDETVQTTRLELKQDITKPPPRYSEATILSAMEGAGKLVEDEELAQAMKERGLGTPATRAQIIENLVATHYLTRQRKQLQPTAKAIQTIGLLRSIPVLELVTPETTGEWEFRLHEIEHGRLTREEFMRDIRAVTARIVEEAKNFKPDDHVDNPEPFGQCPKCASPLTERFKSYECSGDDCDFVVWKTIAARILTRQEVETLITERQIGPLTGFRSKAKKPFDAVLKLNDEFKVEFDFAATTEAAKTEITCDKCGAPMIIRSGRRGEFLACSGYPECKNALSFNRTEDGTIVPVAAPPPIKTEETCEKCGAEMVVKRGRRGAFLACSGYPKCKNAKPLPEHLKKQVASGAAAKSRPEPEPTDEKCEKCGAPMLKRQGRYGPFLGCSAYPKCKTIKKIEPAET